MTHRKLSPTLGESIDSLFDEVGIALGIFSIVLIVMFTNFAIKEEHVKKYEISCQVNGGEVYEKKDGWTSTSICLKNKTEIRVTINE